MLRVDLLTATSLRTAVLVVGLVRTVFAVLLKDDEQALLQQEHILHIPGSQQSVRSMNRQFNEQ